MRVNHLAAAAAGSTAAGVLLRRPRVATPPAQFPRLLSTAQPPPKNALHRFAVGHPFTFQVIVATLKTSLSDVVVQIGEGKTMGELDWNRNFVFVVFGTVYLGVGQWILYVEVFKRMFPSMLEFTQLTLREKLRHRAGLRALVAQTFTDVFVFTPVLYYPIFYTFKCSIQTDGEAKVAAKTWGQVLDEAKAKYRANITTDMTAFASLWVPGDLVIYALPLWMRLPANHALSFAWTCILSVMRGQEPPSTAQPAK